ncbi:DNA-deoxyinosine glycosylase [Phascolarctobacterium faecium]|uniref:DNA-deoxyinosine glycosylase n=1 Tax=Phascolarctobacterium faecium TaxID=33025 RepID=UPI00210BF51A|nr:DNA-deoxyinosine glycosylase [Phascolarctobacterium faecium]MCQ5184185.1 DNA-deoxyinosine glycosylase [Phascolarctobacterium faecium]
MSECQSFDPVADTDSRLLILGSMPGVRSLQMQQYYGHPQNRFWPLVTMLLGYAEVPWDYADKKQMLLDNSIALWDVLGYCEREGSLDSDITCEQPNDLAGFLQNHPQIHTICCNGGKAAAAFKKYTRQLDLQRITVHFLPSTSPANARWSLTKLLEAWQGYQYRPLKNKKALNTFCIQGFYFNYQLVFPGYAFSASPRI